VRSYAQNKNIQIKKVQITAPCAAWQPSRQHNKGREAAFTLAEVLITLAIIGIIAAITIPSIVANHQKRTLETQFAKSYRTLQQVVNLAVAEHGGIETWNWEDSMTYAKQEEFVKKYFYPRLNIAKYCSVNSPGGCFPDLYYKRLDGSNWSRFSNRIEPQAILADGSLIRFAFVVNGLQNSSRTMFIAVDINGAKKPNTIGLDYHEFIFLAKTGEFLPIGMVNETYNEEIGGYERYSKEEIYEGCNKDNPWQCSARIVVDGFKINY